MLDPSDIVDTTLYDCRQCSHQTASVFQLEYHVRRNHKHVYAAELFHSIIEPEQFRCLCCNYKSYYQFELYEHWKQAHNPKSETNKKQSLCEESARYVCVYCKYPSDSSLSSIKHDNFCKKVPKEEIEDIKLFDLNPVDEKRSKVMKPSDWLKCDQCSYRAGYKSDLKRHMLLIHVADEYINWFRCYHCSYRAKLKTNLIRHMLQHAPKEAIDWFQCYHCSYRAKRKEHLNSHMLSSHASISAAEIVWFRCSHCSYRTKQKKNLKQHAVTHAAKDEINWFQCDHCSHRSKQKSQLKTHMLQHAANEEIKWFQCDHCSYRAKRKDHLKKHMLQHVPEEEINWFQCSHCSYRAKRKEHLKRHMLIHAT